MKVSSEKSSFKIGKLLKYLLVLGAVVLVANLLIDYVSRPTRSDLDKQFYCDAEDVSGGNFVTDGIEFSNGDTQSSQDAYTGRYSSKCTAAQIYSMALTLPTAQALDTIMISVAIKCVDANARVVVSSGENKFFEFKTVKNGKPDWQLINYEVILPLGYKAGDTKIYTYFTDGLGHLFVDDMNVKVGVYNEAAPLIAYDGALMRIKLTRENLNKIKAKRKSALMQGLLFSSKDDLVDGDLRIDEKLYAVDLRLKGDLLDHLKGDKWSFRVQLKGGDEWNGMKNFSIHNSQARSHLYEWVLHRLFKDEGIMTPAYDFVKVELNENPLGVYAYEQHFDNQLLKYNDRLIGPILKHNDDAYWENVQKYPDPFPWIDASYIELFNKENGKDENFKELFNKGQAMLNDFLEERKTPAEIFDIDKLTTYYALLDLSHSLHAQIFTNIRFYLDPVSGKLEPIGFDCFGSDSYTVTAGWDAVGEGVNERYANWPKNNVENTYQFKLLKDPEYFKLYMEKIYKYSAPEYLEGKKKEYGKEIMARELFIRSDESYASYEFLWDNLFKKAEFTRNKLQPKENMSLRVFRSAQGKQSVDLLSHHPFPIEVVAMVDVNGSIDTLTAPLLLEPYNEYVPVRPYHLSSSKSIQSVRYRMVGNDEIISVPVVKNVLPVSHVDVVSSDINDISRLSFASVRNKVITIASGRHMITQPLVIPKGYSLNISTGVELVFDGGSLLSYGDIQAIGSPKQKIIFKSNGKPGSSILLSGATQESIFKYCSFVGFNNYKYKNVAANGSVNVYKSKVKFDDCIFSGSKSREGLSLIFSEIQLNDCVILNTKGDGINAKYSTLNTNSLEVRDVGGNGIDITGGSITGSGINIAKSFARAVKWSDKVIANVKKLSISDTESAIMISQNSNVIIEGCSLVSVIDGIIVKGKSEKASKVVITDYVSEKVKNEYKVALGSELSINGDIKK